jgi:hypothetical protein
MPGSASAPVVPGLDRAFQRGNDKSPDHADIELEPKQIFVGLWRHNTAIINHNCLECRSTYCAFVFAILVYCVDSLIFAYLPFISFRRILISSTYNCIYDEKIAIFAQNQVRLTVVTQEITSSGSRWN